MLYFNILWIKKMFQFQITSGKLIWTGSFRQRIESWSFSSWPADPSTRADRLPRLPSTTLQLRSAPTLRPRTTGGPARRSSSTTPWPCWSSPSGIRQFSGTPTKDSPSSFQSNCWLTVFRYLPTYILFLVFPVF